MIKFSMICHIFLISAVFVAVLALEDDCPIGKYMCKSKVKRCIDLLAICDGKNDCPDGEDETSSYCKESALKKGYQNYNPGNSYVNEQDHYVKAQNKQVKTHGQTENNGDDQGDRYWFNNGCAAGQYLCNGTLNICVKLRNICDGVQDCPQNDDEGQEACKNRPVKPKTVGIKDMAASALKKLPAALLGQMKRKNEMNMGGTGFMFEVDNLIIVNSSVRMFNQNSDNVDTILN